VLVAVDADGGLLGDVTYVPGPGPLAELEEEGDAGIRMLGVSPAAQRGAIGRRLVEACVARARDDGRSRIVLHTAPAMTGAQALYGALGFVRAAGLDGRCRARASWPTRSTWTAVSARAGGTRRTRPPTSTPRS
jgi:ribosomal protein S18 acetylase RimI-like enzyme